MKMRMSTCLGVVVITLTTIAATVLPSAATPDRPGWTATGSTAGTALACAVTWGSLPKEVQTTSSATTLTNVRAGQHDCFDRMVLDGSSFIRAEYVDQVRADGSGFVVPLRGGAKLQIVTTTAYNSETMVQTYRPANPKELVAVAGWQTFRQAAMAGDFEGQATIGLGVRARLPFRVFALATGDGPPRMVIDVAHHW